MLQGCPLVPRLGDGSGWLSWPNCSYCSADSRKSENSVGIDSIHDTWRKISLSRNILFFRTSLWNYSPWGTFFKILHAKFSLVTLFSVSLAKSFITFDSLMLKSLSSSLNFLTMKWMRWISQNQPTLMLMMKICLIGDGWCVNYLQFMLLST